MIVSETHLTPRHRFNLKGYITYRKDKTLRSGGVAILIKNDIPHRQVEFRTLNALDDGVKHVSVELEGRVVILGIYVHPKYKLSDIDLDTIFGVGLKVVATGG